MSERSIALNAPYTLHGRELRNVFGLTVAEFRATHHRENVEICRVLNAHAELITTMRKLRGTSNVEAEDAKRRLSAWLREQAEAAFAEH